MSRDYAEEHRGRKLISDEDRAAREAKRAARNAEMVAAGEIAWSTGNEKLRKLGILSFGIPAGGAKDGFNTCPAKGACASWCYARQGFYVWPHVSAAHERNLAIVRGDLERFVQLALRDLGIRKRPKVVRVHDAGDFFSAAYLKAWLTIARRLPQITFYAYTKMFHRLKKDFALAPRNFRIIQSLAGQDDAHANLGFPHARVFVSHEEREAAGYVDGTQSDEPAINGAVRIGIVYHSGGKKLTEAQASGLRVLPTGKDLAEGERHDVGLTLKAAVELTGDITNVGEAEPGPPDGEDDVDLVDRMAERERLRRELAEIPDNAPPDSPPPSFRTVTVALNKRQWELLENLVSVGACGDTQEAAAAWILAEGLLRHFPKAFASLGFRP